MAAMAGLTYHYHDCFVVGCGHGNVGWSLPDCPGCRQSPPGPPSPWGQCHECGVFVRMVEPGGNLPPFWAHVIPVRGHVARPL